MVKFYLYLPGLLFLASCTHTPKPLRTVESPEPAFRSAAVDKELAPESPEEGTIGSDEGEAAYEPEPEVVEPEVTESEVVEPVMVEPEGIRALIDEPTEAEHEAVETEAEAEPSTDLAENGAISVAMEPVESEPEVPEPGKADVVATAEDKKPEIEPDSSAPVEAAPPFVESPPAERKLPEKEAEAVQKADDSITTQLTVVSMMGTAINFYSDDKLLSSVPPSAITSAGVRYVGPKELDLWKSLSVDGEVVSSVMESVGTVTLPTEATSCLVFCVGTQATSPDGETFHFVLLPEGQKHVPENSICFVNLTASELKIRIRKSDFRVPSRSHYDFQLKDDSGSILPARIEVQSEGEGAFSGTISGQWQQAPVFLLTDKFGNRNGAIQVQALRYPGMSEDLLITPDSARPETENIRPPSIEGLQPIQPDILPGNRTF